MTNHAISAWSTGSGTTSEDDQEPTYEPPFLPETRTGAGSLYDRIARARKAREDAEERVKQRYKKIKDVSDERRWRVNERQMSPLDETMLPGSPAP